MNFARTLLSTLLLGVTLHAADRPNIVFAIADDWSWPHAGVYGNDEVCQTPTFDRIARSGILFHHAYISSPSCTPSRNAILTGQYHWRLGEGGDLWSVLDTRHQTYPHLIEDSGYFTGSWRKSWGPGDASNWKRYPAGERFKSPDEFLTKWKASGDDKPFCFWFGSGDPHRPYEKGSGAKSGMDFTQIKLFEHFPESPEVRGDVADYYFEVRRFDRELGEFLDKLDKFGVLDNTLVVVTGDNGMPFPRCKANLYYSGARVPLAIQWPKVIKGGRQVEDFVSTTDLAPTFLEAAGLKALPAMTGHSLMPIMTSEKSGRLEPEIRDHVLTGKERHALVQEAPDTGGTPMRAIRTHDFLFIKNYRTDRWPAGTPNHEKATLPGSWLGDCDNGPTKFHMVENKDKDAVHRLKYELAFGKRPRLELYDLKKDPGQMHNVAYSDGYREIAKSHEARMEAELKESEDPRMFGKGEETFDTPKYLGTSPRFPGINTTGK